MLLAKFSFIIFLTLMNQIATATEILVLNPNIEDEVKERILYSLSNWAAYVIEQSDKELYNVNERLESGKQTQDSTGIAVNTMKSLFSQVGGAFSNLTRDLWKNHYKSSVNHHNRFIQTMEFLTDCEFTAHDSWLEYGKITLVLIGDDSFDTKNLDTKRDVIGDSHTIPKGKFPKGKFAKGSKLKTIAASPEFKKMLLEKFAIEDLSLAPDSSMGSPISMKNRKSNGVWLGSVSDLGADFDPAEKRIMHQERFGNGRGVTVNWTQLLARELEEFRRRTFFMGEIREAYNSDCRPLLQTAKSAICLFYVNALRNALTEQDKTQSCSGKGRSGKVNKMTLSLKRVNPWYRDHSLGYVNRLVATYGDDLSQIAKHFFMSPVSGDVLLGNKNLGSLGSLGNHNAKVRVLGTSQRRVHSRVKAIGIIDAGLAVNRWKLADIHYCGEITYDSEKQSGSLIDSLKKSFSSHNVASNSSERTEEASKISGADTRVEQKSKAAVFEIIVTPQENVITKTTNGNLNEETEDLPLDPMTLDPITCIAVDLQAYCGEEVEKAVFGGNVKRNEWNPLSGPDKSRVLFVPGGKIPVGKERLFMLVTLTEEKGMNLNRFHGDWKIARKFRSVAHVSDQKRQFGEFLKQMGGRIQDFFP